MKRKTRLAKGQGSMKDRSRLTTTKNEPTGNDSRHEIVTMMRDIPSSRVMKYAGIKNELANANPAMGMLKEEAIKEVGRRKMLMTSWKVGKASPEEAKSKKPLREQLLKWTQKGAHYLGRGVEEYMKVITGEKAQELQEWIETTGMSPEEKKKFTDARIQHAKESAEAESKEVARVAKVEEQDLAEIKEIASGKIPEEFRLKGGDDQEPARPELARPEPVAPEPVRPERKDGKGTVINIYANDENRRPVSQEMPMSVGRDDENIHDIINQERAELQSEMDRPFDSSQESLYDIINEGRGAMDEERTLLDQERGFRRGKKK